MTSNHKDIRTPLIYFFILVGIMSVSIFIHEGVHIWEAKEPLSICYAIGQEGRMYVETPTTEPNLHESWAYGIQGLTMVGMFYLALKWSDDYGRNRAKA